MNREDGLNFICASFGVLIHYLFGYNVSVWSAGWVWDCLPNPAGMLFSVESFAEHSVAVHRQKSLVSVLR